ncbi:hypothetical protein [Devosia sp. MC1541]|uniref:hypothetical protein n=1 Tax=Devosia sp. MC1541 TaxID=2725264 RepID=UPI00145E4347|nr:hypothetical protein [Devosia sp. MC1541]
MDVGIAPIPAVERGFTIAGKPTLPIERSYGELGVGCGMTAFGDATEDSRHQKFSVTLSVVNSGQRDEGFRYPPIMDATDPSSFARDQHPQAMA